MVKVKGRLLTAGRMEKTTANLHPLMYVIAPQLLGEYVFGELGFIHGAQ